VLGECLKIKPRQAQSTKWQSRASAGDDYDVADHKAAQRIDKCGCFRRRSLDLFEIRITATNGDGIQPNHLSDYACVDRVWLGNSMSVATNQ